ncbi:MAG TPA: S8 family serine peptidase [Solirubrobacteraceae bacterium]|nr:S8 family serine peptidase [Solirubrobacteraceae bacterium]
MTRRGKWIALLAAVALASTGTAVAAGSDFDHPASNDTSQQFAYGPPLGPGNVQRQDVPNDPDYDSAEPDSAHRTSTNLYDERFDLFGFPSQLTPTAQYAVGPNAGKPQIAGFNAAGAWKLTRGRPDVTIAILDTGIRWDRRGLRDKIHLNTGELPLPERADGSTDPSAPHGGYDLNRDGAVNVDDYANDPRVSLSYAGREGPAGLVTGQDLLHAFGDCQLSGGQIVRCIPGSHFDNDANGYANDIAGWNFFDDSNDPTDRSSYFSAANHGSGRASDAAEQGNDGDGSIGVCPDCQIMPIRVWDTFVSDGNTFGLGILYASDNGAQVIEGADGSTYHSAFAQAASEYAYEKGVTQTYSGDDLNTANHNYPGNYNHTILVQGSVPDTVGLGQDAGQQFDGLPLGTQLPVGTFFRGANITQYGGHSSLTMEGTTGSENTGKAAGAAGMVVSAALDRGYTLRADEVREILEQSAEHVLTGNTTGTGAPDPAADPTAPPDKQWSSHFGWGRVNLGAAVSVAASGAIPPEAAIDSPDWYAPLTGASATITGLARARFAPGGAFHYKLEWAPGQDPGNNGWHTVAQGDATGSVTNLGTIDLDAVRAALATYAIPPDSGGPTFSATAPNPLRQQFTVQLTVTGAGIPTEGVDRKVLDAFSDPTLRPGYPKRLGTGGEAPIRYADLDGDGTQELIVPTEDGYVHAYEPDGSELKGWPVRTLPQSQAQDHLSSPGLSTVAAPLEPPRGPVIADLKGDGRPDVVTAAGTHIYAWDAKGHAVKGFPLAENRAFCDPSDEHQPLDHRKCGFLATPALGHLEGPGKPIDIVASSLDGHLYAWRADGTPLPGFPVDLSDPSVPANQRMLAESINDPAIGDLNGDGKDDVVVASNEVYGAQQPAPADLAGGFQEGLSDVLANAIGGSTRVYAVNGASGAFLPGWPVKLNSALPDALPLVGPGNDAELVKVGGQQTVVLSTTGGALSEYAPDGTLIRSAQQDEFGPASNVTDRSDALNLFESAAVGDVLGTGRPALVKYGLTLGGLANLAVPGQNFPYNHTIGAYDAGTGQPLPAWPTVTDDYQFLSSSTVAKIDPALPDNQVLAQTGLGLLHAYDGLTGQDVSGFPKQTAGWIFAPAALSQDGRVAAITREGYLFEWSTKAPACQPEWPSFRHDQHDTGDYDADATPPSAPTNVSLTSLGAGLYRLSFTAPGNDGTCGTPAAYLAQADGAPIALPLGAPLPGGSTVTKTVLLPSGTSTLTLQARDAAGNVGPPATIAVP